MPAVVRETWRMRDGDVASIDRVRGHPNAPRLIIFHGLEGGAHSTYARGALREAGRRGWWADLVLWRTCDDRSVNDVERSYHSGASDDADEAIRYIVNADPERPTFVVGVSLGGNVLLKWLGEAGTSIPTAIRGAAAVSVPFDLAAASARLERGLSRVYARFFLRSLRTKAVAKVARYPRLGDETRIRSAGTLREFDDLVTAPLHGFRDADDYYAQCSSLGFLGRIRVRTLLLNAEDDPFLPREVLTRVRLLAAENPALTCVFPARGGHAGFVSGLIPGRAEYWMEPFVLDWLTADDGRWKPL